MFRTKKHLVSALLFFICLLCFVFIANAETVIVFGDITGDGFVRADDARMALRCSVKLEICTSEMLLAGDVDEDGRISASDARTILRCSVKLEELKKDKIIINDNPKAPDNLTNSDTPLHTEKPNIFERNIPVAPEVNAPSNTFTFNVYGYGHGVGISQYGAIALEKAGYTYDEIIRHYYKGTEIKYAEEFPAETIYPGFGKISTVELLTRIVYQEIYGITSRGKYKESLKASALCVFTLLIRHDFAVTNRWDVGIASSLPYELIPESLKNIVLECLGQYITKKGETAPIQAVYTALSAGRTASSKDIWGVEYSYLVPAESPFDMEINNFISQVTYTAEEIKEMINEYDSEIILSDNPEEWFEIISHDKAIDDDRGYVIEIRVGDKVLSGYNAFLMNLMNNELRSACFTITYTP